MRFAPTLLAAWTLVAPPAFAAEPQTADEIRSCVVANAIGIDNVQAIELRARDRVGGERRIRGNVYTRRNPDGFARVLVRLVEPADLDGAAFLLIQRPEGNELVVRSPELGTVKRIARDELAGSIAGTDFSYEDFVRMQRLNRPAALRRLPDETLEDRPVWVLESRPAPEEGSAYERIRAFVDRGTCLMLRVELYEGGDKLRKVMTANPERFREVGSVWVTREVRLQDVRDGTETTMTVETFDVDAEIPATTFTVESLTKLAAPPAGD